MNYSEICRLCLIKSSKLGDELFFPIDEAFEKKFSEITNSLLSNNENYPKTTCITCLSEFEKHYNYRNGLIEKQNRLDLLLCIKEEKVYDEESQIEELIEESSSDARRFLFEEFGERRLTLGRTNRLRSVGHEKTPAAEARFSYSL